MAYPHDDYYSAIRVTNYIKPSHNLDRHQKGLNQGEKRDNSKAMYCTALFIYYSIYRAVEGISGCYGLRWTVTIKG